MTLDAKERELVGYFKHTILPLIMKSQPLPPIDPVYDSGRARPYVKKDMDYWRNVSGRRGPR